MNTLAESQPAAPDQRVSTKRGEDVAYAHPRNFLGRRFVYVVFSPRARGLSVGINFNPDKQCNFDCVYCEVDRQTPPSASSLDVDEMSREFVDTMNAVRSGALSTLPAYRNLPPNLLRLQHVTLSGDGEPTLSPQFLRGIEAVIHVRALGRFSFFKLVLVTNGSGLDRPEVQTGLKLLTRSDEIWAKLDAGTQSWMDRVNRSQVPLAKILANILTVARERPVIIQSLIPAIRGVEPPASEIQALAQRLQELKEAGAQISLVQIYSATRPTPHSECGHLPLRTLSRIAQTIQHISGLKAQVF